MITSIFKAIVRNAVKAMMVRLEKMAEVLLNTGYRHVEEYRVGTPE